MTTTTTDTTAISRGPILSTTQLRAETEHAEALKALFDERRATIGNWLGGLHDAYVEAPIGTTALSLAVNHATDGGGAGTGMEVVEINEALAEMLTALDEADGLGDQVQEINAKGSVDAFKAK